MCTLKYLLHSPRSSLDLKQVPCIFSASIFRHVFVIIVVVAWFHTFLSFLLFRYTRMSKIQDKNYCPSRTFGSSSALSGMFRLIIQKHSALGFGCHSLFPNTRTPSGKKKCNLFARDKDP